MRKFLLSLVLAVTVLSGTIAMAVDSPEATPNRQPERNPNVSPKTADVSTLAFAGAGVICLGGVVFCARKANSNE